MINLKEQSLKIITSWKDYKVDPRYFVLLFLFSFTLAGMVYLGFFQSWKSILTGIVVSVTTEVVLTRLVHKVWRFPLSAVITGTGVGLLISSPYPWIYALTSFLSIVIKMFVRFKKGHIFNPNNIAVVLVLFTLNQYAVSTPKQWTNGFEIMMVILLLGIFATYMANRLDVVLSFLGSFTLFGLLRHYWLGAPMYAALGPLMGASLQLFAFFMITDPKSTPSTRRERILFAFLVGALDAIFRIYRIPNPQFYALSLISLLTIIPFRIWIAKRINKTETGI
ncbi:NQR2, RnfD, RnfE family [Fictibacillus solisalsi]|uniref:NQR2, RnfD, RnfE family n=1 Tax=Fictibacillus solisalsi TaxID=459525 RepID=A0A1H0BPL9_9BACL|nr:RnfABCDGE type electron transport complex subunit D [Fictibacillus solisalsi]SDN47600.1 NQR2, RnfD, RnfE family [Fictibacillus solisalsi]